MSLTVTLDTITSTVSSHTATRHRSTGVGPGLWSVSWLPSRLLTRDEAVTAMRIAEFTTSADEAFFGELARWAYELDLTAEQAWDLAIAPAPRSSNTCFGFGTEISSGEVCDACNRGPGLTPHALLASATA